MGRQTPITSEYLKSILRYDPETGLFSWIHMRNGVRRDGRPAGSIDRHGHRQLRIDGAILFAHRLAWLYMNGEWPDGNIDHINGVRDDNRIANLRVVTQGINMQNQRGPGSRNTSGYLGVTWDKKARKWVAQIMLKRKRYWLGAFDDPAMAHERYVQAKRLMHVGCTI
jgi:hypothetical protein